MNVATWAAITWFTKALRAGKEGADGIIAFYITDWLFMLVIAATLAASSYIEYRIARGYINYNWRAEW